MTQTPPAADGGLPGPLPWRIDDSYVVDAKGIIIFDGLKARFDAASFVAWINAQAVRLAKKDAAIESARVCCDSYAVENQQLHDRATTAEAQLAAATTRLAIAEAVIAKIGKEADFANNVIAHSRDGGGQGRVKVATSMHRIAQEARAWLTSKDGEKQP